MTPPKDYAAKLKFRSALSKTMRDGVTAPCSKSFEREKAIACSKVELRKPNPEKMCVVCSEALVFGGGGGKRKRKGKGAKR